MSKTNYFNLQPSETAIFQAAVNIYTSYIVTDQITSENQEQKMKEAIATSILMARHVEKIVESDAQISGEARQRLSNTVREEDILPHI
jgi:hypothetical protein